MAAPKGHHLYVNLSATQTRRRLKGFGHGVRRIQSAGKNRAVVVHTATGRHEEELMRQFADVGCAAREEDLGSPIENLRNLGSTSAGWLREAGVRTIDDLEQIGPAKTWNLVKLRHPEAGRNLLWALSAGLEHRDWRELTEHDRNTLLAQVED